MPRPSIFHRNRSQASLNTQDANDRRSHQASPIDSPLHSPAFPKSSVTSTLGPDEEEDRYYQPYRPEEARGPGGVHRSQSQRVHQPTIHLVPSPTQANAEPLAFDDNPDSYYQQQPTPASHKEEPKRRSLFSLRNSSTTKEPANNASGNRLGRSISVRKKVPAPGVSTGPTPTTFLPSSHNDEVVGGEANSNTSHLQPGPPPPEKDPQLNQSQPLTHTEHPYNRPLVQGVVTNSFSRQPLERQGSSTSSAWESTGLTTQQQQQQQQHRTPLEPNQQPLTYQSSPSSATSSSHHPLHQQAASYQPSPSSATSTSSHPLQSRAPQGALQQLYSEKKTSRPNSQQSFGPPSPLHPPPRANDNYQPRPSTNPGPQTPYFQAPMGPPPPQHQQPPNKRSEELAPQHQSAVLNREGSGYQAYHQGAQGQSQPPSAPPPYSSQLGINSSQGNNQRGPPQSSPMPPQNTSEDRSTPPPSRSRDDLTGPDTAQLQQRHDELQDKYRKVKKYYFDKDAQVQQLQNTLAHQRLSLSRTSLDDNEYANRFQRLDGAINNLAFNVRREWRSVPSWLAPQVNKEATTTPSKEMTAVGRACISRWLVDEIFDRYFHPSLDPIFSAQLKIIEKNLRRFASPTPSDEEKEMLIGKISNWRLATLDGLSELLGSAQAAEYRATLTETLQEKLKACLGMHLKQPPPAELEPGVESIMELAIGIAANLPLESRDVFVEYITPGAAVNEAYMKIESGLPALTNPGSSEGHESSDKSSEETALEGSSKDGASEEPGGMEERAQQQPRPGSVTAGKEAAMANKKKGSMFGGFIGGKKAGAVAGGSGPQAVQPPQQQKTMEERVRFATFMVVEVRGRIVLVKAPVYTFKAPSS